MRRLMLVFAIAMAVGCTASTPHGKCIGAFDEKDPKKEYQVSAWNVFWAVLGVNFIVPPVLVVTQQFYCPTGVK